MVKNLQNENKIEKVKKGLAIFLKMWYNMFN